MPQIQSGGKPGVLTELNLASWNNEPADYRIEHEGGLGVGPPVITDTLTTEGVKKVRVRGKYTVSQTGGRGNLHVQAQRQGSITESNTRISGQEQVEADDPNFAANNPTATEPPDDRTQTQKQQETRDAVRSTRGENAPAPVVGADAGAGGVRNVLMVGALLGMAYYLFN